MVLTTVYPVLAYELGKIGKKYNTSAHSQTTRVCTG